MRFIVDALSAAVTPHMQSRVSQATSFYAFLTQRHCQCIDNQYSLACNVILVSDDDKAVMVFAAVRGHRR
jgi:hypothetical protein